MKNTALATLALGVVFLAAACSTKGVPPIRSEFMDVPLPGGLAFVAKKSTVIESETVRAARLVYASRFEPGSLVLSLQEGLVGNGWRLVRSTSFPEQGTLQVYEKGDAALQVRVWEGGVFGGSTYVELSATRALPRVRATALTR